MLFVLGLQLVKLNNYISKQMQQITMQNYLNYMLHMTGLSRCRKSCRLRWLNYLSPNIKRESFAEDEVDMMLRLHKLLGNR